ncbi:MULTISPECIES: hydroxysqualene dehydroxylase [Paenibacillus]|uniref:hydroxysqualene dehydroxylase n=1 Tax=Paenibacillus TaxID=44249 RepID=UPI0022B93DA8|nr:FAD-dependent oxidoreductase [Paenibacillus caseinilyticus]MCZ8521758.1 FAD-dependent oxidoreductase [Paenibacillus caseinilyticus]
MEERRKVVILGGGVAGLTAAHELLERGFAVELYEKRGIFGGKARSYAAEAAGGSGLKNLPGEHGFRIFPRFYRHVIDTMQRIPSGDPKKDTVYDHLVPVSRLGFATSKAPLFQLSAKMSLSLKDFIINRTSFQDHHAPYGVSITEEDTKFFMGKLWQIMTSCRERWDGEYQLMDWWDFIEAEDRSRAYQNGFAGVVKALIACDPKKANAKTVGSVQAQLSLDLISPGRHSYVSLLDGPTNEVWINPWMEFLIDKGLVYHNQTAVTRLHCREGQIDGVTVTESGGLEREVHGDYYIAALPVEVMAGLIDPALTEADPVLGNITRLKEYVDWMNGIQFYLSEDVPIIHGHVSHMDAPWGLTSVSQRQFWRGVDWKKYGDGTVKGILSVDISNWEARGIVHPELTAKQCNPQQIKEEVWAQLQKCLNVDEEILSDEILIGWHMDSDVMDTSPHREVNLEPLLINAVGSWELRPEAGTKIPNLLLASDYVRTNTDLATMEGANEAARRAVNAILARSGSTSKHCRIWPMYEYEIFGFPVLGKLQEEDRQRYEQGLPWNSDWKSWI